MAQQEIVQPEQSQMGILEHLNELRIYVTRAFIGLFVGVIIAFIFTEAIVDFLVSCNYPSIILDSATVKEACGKIITIGVTENIENFFKVALRVGAGIAMPWMVYQVWQFIAPGLHKHERRYVFIFVPAITLLFIGGVLFAWALLMPPALFFLNTFLSGNLEISWTLDSYLSFVTGFLFYLGVAFEMPLLFYFLARFGFVSSKALRDNWRFAIVGIAVLAAVITPSIDPVTMIMTMVPLTVLYLSSIGMSALGYRQFMNRS